MYCPVLLLKCICLTSCISLGSWNYGVRLEEIWNLWELWRGHRGKPASEESSVGSYTQIPTEGGLCRWGLWTSACLHLLLLYINILSWKLSFLILPPGGCMSLWWASVPGSNDGWEVSTNIDYQLVGGTPTLAGGHAETWDWYDI